MNEFSPLAVRMRPRNLQEYVGQSHLLAAGKPLYRAITQGRLHSMILWGAPGTGKTTLAHILADSAGARVERISAVLAGVKDIREIVKRAELARKEHQATICLSMKCTVLTKPNKMRFCLMLKMVR